MNLIKQYKHRIQANQLMLEDKSRLAESPYGTIEYSVRGEKGPYVLIIHSLDDTVIPYDHAEYASEKIRNAQLMTLSKGGHLKLSHRKEIQSRIENFLRRIIDEKHYA